MAEGRAREEFMAEAQELVDSLRRDLLVLDAAQRQGQADPDALNGLFRGVHTLKGLAGMFSIEVVGRLAHVLEDLLEELRLGRVEMTQDILDLLFEGSDGFAKLLHEVSTGEPAGVDVQAFADVLHSVGKVSVGTDNVLEAYELDRQMLAVLTEYEEHRLRANLEQGKGVFRLYVCLALDTIDSALEDIKERCRGTAEIITYLPSMDSTGKDVIDIEMWLASGTDEAGLRAVLKGVEAKIERVQRRPMPAPAGRVGASVAPTGPTGAVAAPVVPAEQPQEPTSPEGRPAAGVVPVSTNGPSTAVSPPAAGGSQVESSPHRQRTVPSAVRVDIRKLDYLMNIVGELGTLRSQIGRVLEDMRTGSNEHRKLVLDIHRIHRMFHRHLTEVQEGVLDIRMVPLSQLFDKIAVIVRQAARELDKDVQLNVVGAQTEVDKLIAEDLADPLMHIVRNAIDHGVEKPDKRESSGKVRHGTLTVAASHKGNHVVIEVSDDGAGVRLEAVRETAVRKGVLSPQAAVDLTRHELMQVIFMPGFSTAAKVTDLSGRGVGMDVVKTNITRLGGSVDVESVEGEGTRFIITLPITLAIVNALLFEIKGRLFSIPLSSVQEALIVDPGSLQTVESREVLTLRGETLPLCRLAVLFMLEQPAQPLHSAFVIVVVVGQRRIGLVVDRLAGQQDIVIKSLGKSLSQVPGISGATDLGDGRLVLVVDAAAILDEVLSLRRAQLRGGAVC